MRCPSLLALCLILPGGLILAQGRDPLPRPAESRKSPAPPKPAATKTAATVAKAPAPAAAPAAKPAGSQRPEPVRTRAQIAAEAKSAEAAARRPLEPSTIGVFLNAWQARLSACAYYQTDIRHRLKAGFAEIEQIEKDRTLRALSSRENRDLVAAADIPERKVRDWVQQFRASANPMMPTDAERVMRDAEALAFRGQPSSSETKRLIGKTSEVSNSFLTTDVSAAGGLMVPNIYPVPGPLDQVDDKRPYAFRNVAALRSAIDVQRSTVTGQHQAMRQEWLQWNARGEELHRRYADLRVSLPFREE
jgi:hypothetical protein